MRWHQSEGTVVRNVCNEESEDAVFDEIGIMISNSLKVDGD